MIDGPIAAFPGYRCSREGIPIERVEIDHAALQVALDEYEAITGAVDEVAFERAVRTYLEGCVS